MHFEVPNKSLSPLNGDLEMGTVSVPLQWCKGSTSSLRCQDKTRFSAAACRYFSHSADESCSVTDTLKLGDEVQQVRRNAGITQELIGVCQYPPPLAGVSWNNWENTLKMWQPVNVFFLSASNWTELAQMGHVPWLAGALVVLLC